MGKEIIGLSEWVPGKVYETEQVRGEGVTRPLRHPLNERKDYWRVGPKDGETSTLRGRRRKDGAEGKT